MQCGPQSTTPEDRRIRKGIAFYPTGVVALKERRVTVDAESVGRRSPVRHEFFQTWMSGEAVKTRETSLRCLVEKWLGRDSATRARVTRFSRSRTNRWRYVCVEAMRPAGGLSIIFFRHEDGSWCVFPPEIKRPAMNVARMPALPGADMGVGSQWIARA